MKEEVKDMGRRGNMEGVEKVKGGNSLDAVLIVCCSTAPPLNKSEPKIEIIF